MPISTEDIKQTYKLGRMLGKGGYAIVKKGKCFADGKEHAVKIIRRDTLSKQDLKNLSIEIELIQRLNHEHIVSTKEIFAPADEPFVYIVMELMAGGELFDRIVEKECYSEEETQKAFADILKAMKFLHDEGIVHRDLKPENLLYNTKADDAVLKLADFGLAHLIKEGQLLQSACGTPCYVAPEILAKQGYGKEVDMWSLGVILYILLSGCPPFYQEENSELFAAILAGDYTFPSPDWDDISENAIDLGKRHVMYILTT
jgi:calcium/calmodulin-dependent protein kinase I